MDAGVLQARVRGQLVILERNNIGYVIQPPDLLPREASAPKIPVTAHPVQPWFSWADERRIDVGLRQPLQDRS